MFIIYELASVHPEGLIEFISALETEKNHIKNRPTDRADRLRFIKLSMIDGKYRNFILLGHSLFAGMTGNYKF